MDKDNLFHISLVALVAIVAIFAIVPSQSAISIEKTGAAFSAGTSGTATFKPLEYRTCTGCSAECHAIRHQCFIDCFDLRFEPGYHSADYEGQTIRQCQQECDLDEEYCYDLCEDFYECVGE